ncbi:MAG: glycosyltransferase family 4 protein, partial [Verrucomicrobiota bacterium]|nr:glycosyltransferase family 4 protein [Verrucomicrobiota bacterium]
MPTKPLPIAFVRRGHSSSGGAEAYLKRLAAGVAALGHPVRLITTPDWPAGEWPFGEITSVHGDSPKRFADQVAALRSSQPDEITLSLDRLWACDVYRAGDGVHAAWLERRSKFSGPLRNFVRRLVGKHDQIVALEASLFSSQGAGRVIVNSEMVKAEIERIYGFAPDRIDVVRNGIPVADFAQARDQRAKERAALGLNAGDLAILFVGSGWERKGLQAAAAAVDRFGGAARLIVAGRGNEARYRASRIQFVGVRETTALYGAADLFLLPTIYDPFSNACLEALAAGLPVITTTANGFSEIIQSGVH